MKIKHLLYSAAIGTLLLSQACTPDDHTMPAADKTPAELAEGIAYTITPDSDNPNIIHLQSNMPSSYQIFWGHPGIGLGHSAGASVDLKIAFEGKYPIVFGVNTRGGVVYSDTTYITISDFYAGFVSTEKWIQLAGGGGASKTWVPDNGKYGMKQGFYSCFDPSATPEDMVCEEGGNWYAKDKTWWEPANGDVGITDDDLAQTMTFSLEGAAKLTVTDKDGNETTGSFVYDDISGALDADGVEFAHGAWANGKSQSFSKGFQVMVINDNQLMIANKRDPALSGEDECWYVWNFVSKEYADSHQGEETEEGITLPDNWKQDIQEITVKTTSIKWTLSDQNPLDWAKMNGSLMNGWTNPSDYPDWLGTPNYDDYKDFSVTFNSADNSVTFVTPNGDETSGKYSIDNDGIYSFEDVKVPTFSLVGWATFNPDANGQLRILSIEKDDDLNVIGMWLGSKDSNKDEYFAYHLVCSAANGSTETKLALPEGKYYLNEVPEGYWNGEKYGNTWENGEKYITDMIDWWKFGNPDYKDKYLNNPRYAYNAYTSQYIEVKSDKIIVHAVWPKTIYHDEDGNVTDEETKIIEYSEYTISDSEVEYTLDGKTIKLSKPISLYTPFGDTFQDKFTEWVVVGKAYTPTEEIYANCDVQLAFLDPYDADGTKVDARRVTFWRTIQADDLYKNRSEVPAE